MTNDTAASNRGAARPEAVEAAEAVEAEHLGEARDDTASALREGPAGTRPDPDAPPGERPLRAAIGVLTALALTWLAVMLWVAHASVSSDTGAVALATAASSLPSVVSAALVAGAAAGLIGAGLIGAVRSAGARFGAAIGAGALTGLAAGAAFVMGSGTDPARMVLAGTLAAAATIGGAVAGAQGAGVVPAVVAAALAVFTTGFIFGLAQTPIQNLYGADGGEAARLSAAGWFAATSAIASGLVAGATAYRVLGGARRNPGLRWPAYLAAGAGPGMLLLVTELIVRTGGNGLLSLVRDISAADRTFQAWAGGSRINNALVVGFVGAIVALIALGRTLDPSTADEDPAGSATQTEAGSA